MNTSTKQISESVEEIQVAMDKLQYLRATMTFLLTLTPIERQEYKSHPVTPGSLWLLEKRAAAARENRDELPPSFDLRRFERDAQRTHLLQEFLKDLDELRGSVKDTLLSVGSRAVQAGAVAYGHMKVAAGPAKELRWAVRPLASRPGRSRSRPKPAASTEGAVTPEPPDAADREVA